LVLGADLAEAEPWLNPTVKPVALGDAILDCVKRGVYGLKAMRRP
jgi:hypothetical protein